MNYYIILGGPEHLDFFEHNENHWMHRWFWTVPQTAKKGEFAFVYLTAPLSRIVGKVLLFGEPFYNICEFDNPKTQNRWMAEIQVLQYFEPKSELTMSGLRALFPDWRWLSYPRGKSKIPTEIVRPFLELMKKAGSI